MQSKALTRYLPVTLCSAAALALSTPVAAVDFTISGQLNRLIMSVDNGVEDGIVHADNSASGTRLRFEGMGETDGGTEVGLYYETQLQSNPSDKVSVDSLDGDGSGGNVGEGDYFSTRFATVWFKGDFGKLTIGQGSGATDGVAEVDKSGTTVIQYVGASNDLLGSMEYGASGVTVGQARGHFDGLGRNDNLRYDASTGEISFAASIGNGDKTELSAGYAVDNLEIRVGIWDSADSGNDVAGNAISASWIGAGGFNLTASYGSDDRAGDPTNIYFKVGYRAGAAAYAIDWGETSDLTDGDASAMSVAYVRDLMQGVQVYASYRTDSLDGVAGEDDITALVGGARVKF
ncbi:MAG TPA: porin [Gammaproteobacteria bacterium]|jgi:hypothetical protein